MMSCSQEFDEGTGVMPADSGMLRMSIAMPKNAGDTEYDPMDYCTVRIYKYTASDTPEAENGRIKELIRKYESTDEIPTELWLLAGDYSVSVLAGDETEATTTHKSYSGSQDFTIEAGTIQPVTVSCSLRNAIVQVVFDQTVREKFADTAYSYISVGEEFDLASAENGSVPTLKFDGDGTGYFIVPAETPTLCWFFHGDSADEEIGTVEKTGKIENVRAAVKYTLTFRYSKGLGGTLSFELDVDENPEIVDDTISFSPDPTIKGEGFDIDTVQKYIDGSYTFNISALANISALSLSAGSKEYELLGGQHAGISVSQTDPKHYTVTLGADFFAQMYGGNHELTFNVDDADGGHGEKVATFAVQGIQPLGAGDYDLWYNTADFKATVLTASASDIKIGYRTTGGEWTMIAATKDPSQDGLYTAHATDFAAGRDYEYRLFIDSAEVGAQAATTTPAGGQIPDGDFENWSQSGSCIYPYAAGGTQWWDTGNPGSTTLGEEYNLTVSSTDVRPGSQGQYSAYMHSAYPSLLGIGKFAAGSIFFGKFAGTQGTNGKTDFGRPFTFTARPKAVKFWYKNSQGTINKTGNIDKSGTDLLKVFVAFCDWTAPHRVDTSDTSTFFDPRSAEGVTAYGYFETTESTAEWTEKTIEITYNNDDKPNYLVFTFTVSGYGDYFTGSTDSWGYIDDVELIY